MNNGIEFKRDIEDILERWNNYSNKILNIEGPRRVGKTTSIIKFCNEKFQSQVYIDLSVYVDNLIVNELLLKYRRNSSKFLMELLSEFQDDKPIIGTENTVLIIDEIQLNPDLYSILKTLNGDSFGLRIIITGSYMSVLKNYLFNNKDFIKKKFNNNSRLGDCIETYRMRPLSFNEFFSGVKGITLREYLDNTTIIDLKPEKINYIQSTYKHYMVCGGFPYIASEYIKGINKNNTKEQLEENLFQNIGELINTIVVESTIYLNSNTILDKNSSNPNDINEIFEKTIKLVLKNIITHNDDRNIIDNEYKQISKIAMDFNISKVGPNKFGANKLMSDCIMWFVHCGILEMISCKETNQKRFLLSDTAIFNYYESRINLNKGNIMGAKIEHFTYLEAFKYLEKGYKYGRGYNGFTGVNGRVNYGLTDGYELDLILNIENSSRKTITYGIEIKSTGGECKSLEFYTKNNIVDIPVIVNTSNKVSCQNIDGKKITILPVYLLMELLDIVK